MTDLVKIISGLAAGVVAALGIGGGIFGILASDLADAPAMLISLMGVALASSLILNIWNHRRLLEVESDELSE